MESWLLNLARIKQNLSPQYLPQPVLRRAACTPILMESRAPWWPNVVCMTYDVQHYRLGKTAAAIKKRLEYRPEPTSLRLTESPLDEGAALP
jgi:hypothetical protein